MRYSRIAVAGLSLFLFAASSSPAQTEPMPLGTVGPTLANYKKIQAELKMTEEQIQKLAEWTAMEVEKAKLFQASIQNVPAAERREKVLAMVKERSKNGIEFLSELLQPGQLARLRQIEIQARGLAVFEVSAVSEQLRLTADQKASFKSLQAELRSTGQAMTKAFADDREAIRIKFQEAVDSIMKRAVESLSDDQKKTWKEMTGEPFDLQAAFQNGKETAR